MSQMSDDQIKEFVILIEEIAEDYGMHDFHKYGGDGYSGRGMYGRKTCVAFIATTHLGVGQVYMAIGIGVAQGVLPEEALGWVRSQDQLGLDTIVYGDV